MMLSGSHFNGLRTSNFKDWGTLEAWNKYKSQYKCLFVDIDGTLVKNSSHHFPPYYLEVVNHCRRILTHSINYTMMGRLELFLLQVDHQGIGV